MDRRSLGALAVILILLMVIVASAGLDNLPRQLHQSVTAATAHLPADRTALDQNRAFIERAVHDEPVLFQTKAALWHARLDQDRSRLDASAANLASLQQLAKTNRRTDSAKVEKSLAEFDSLRKGAVSDASQVHDEAQRWLDDKHALPKRLDAMRASYDALNTFDIDAATATVHKAMTDWPDKRADLESRVDGLKKLQSDGREVWESSAKLRSAAEENQLAGPDYASLFSAADRLDSLAHQLPDSVGPLNALAGQLYVSWNKQLADLDEEDLREKLRIVRTRFPDATLTGGQTTTEEKWQPVDRAQFRDARREVGMTIEHKPAGKYDSEAEHSVQPPAFAYIAPPGQSNAYGGWTSGVWHWLPEYLILSQLLHASRGPVLLNDYEAYRSARSRGEIFYGRNDEFRPRWSPRGGLGSVLSRSAPRPSPSVSSPSTGWYKERPKPSFGDRAFGGSQYESHGAFSGSRYQSRGSFGMRSYSRGGSFGRGGRR